MAVKRPAEEPAGPDPDDTRAMIEAFVAAGASREKAMTMAIHAKKVAGMFDRRRT